MTLTTGFSVFRQSPVKVLETLTDGFEWPYDPYWFRILRCILGSVFVAQRNNLFYSLAPSRVPPALAPC